MTERYGDPRFYELLDEIADLHSRKNHDYSQQGNPLSNFRRSQAFGVEPWRGIFVRMSDKWSRIEELSKGKTAKNESLRDSLIDNAVYSLLAVLLLDEPRADAYRPALVDETVVEGWQAAAQEAVARYRHDDTTRAIPQTEGGFGYTRTDEHKMGPGYQR